MKKTLILVLAVIFIYSGYQVYMLHRESKKSLDTYSKLEAYVYDSEDENKKEELSRHFGYRFQIAPELHQLSFKATLRDESLNEFLSLLCSITPQLSYRIDATHKVVELVKLEK